MSALAALLPILSAITASASASFTNWENHPVHPLALSPDGGLLAVANLADARVDLFGLSGALPTPVRSIPVGIDPVTVRFRSADELWVVNHMSDTVTVVRPSDGVVLALIRTDDEPCDVVFAGKPERAFISCSQVNAVIVVDPVTRERVATIAIDGEDPRSLAVSPDGTKVYAGIFESGNRTTLVGGGIMDSTTLVDPPNAASDAAGPYGGVNPPPNAGATFDPPLAAGLPTPPKAGLIVKQQSDGRWLDDNNGDWTSIVSGANAAKSGRPVGWNLSDHDVAVIDTTTLGVTYIDHLMNIVMSVAVNPADGKVFAVGTEARNQVRYEPVLNGDFLRVNLAVADDETTVTVKDLNPHLDYTTPTVSSEVRGESVGDPRGIAFSADGSRAFVTGMGSSNVAVFDGDGDRAQSATIAVGEGPTGIVLDDARGRGYVFNRFEGSLSVIDVVALTETARVSLHDATPAPVKAGRRFLYDTRFGSGLGIMSCASCHVDSRHDRLAWDLGDPTGATRTMTSEETNFGYGVFLLSFGGSRTFHPMKGPMVTQTLQDIIGHEPLHWRGDRLGIEEFNGTFTALQAADRILTSQEMASLKTFLASIVYPPNPNRNLDNTLPTNLPLPGEYNTGFFNAGLKGQPLENGNAQRGFTLFTESGLDRGVVSCATCHTVPTGGGGDFTFVNGFAEPIPVGPNGEHHGVVVAIDGATTGQLKVAQLRNVYERNGFDRLHTTSRQGFGMLHDGSIDTVTRFISIPSFQFTNDQEIADMVAFLKSFSGSDLPNGPAGNGNNPPGPPSNDTHAAVGHQLLLSGGASFGAELSQLLQIAGTSTRVELIAKGVIDGSARGWVYRASTMSWFGDFSSQPLATGDLLALSTLKSPITVTVVPAGSGTRLGIDRDEDGFGDALEELAGSNPADANSTPTPLREDMTVF